MNFFTTNILSAKLFGKIIFEKTFLSCECVLGFVTMQNIKMLRRLRILTGKKHPQMKLQRLQKVQIWAFGLLEQQFTSL